VELPCLRHLGLYQVARNVEGCRPSIGRNGTIFLRHVDELQITRHQNGIDPVGPDNARSGHLEEESILIESIAIDPGPIPVQRLRRGIRCRNDRLVEPDRMERQRKAALIVLVDSNSNRRSGNLLPRRNRS
jgi:hypothetical protein